MLPNETASGPPGNDATRGGESAGLVRLGGRSSSVLEVTDELTHLQRRILQDCVNSGLASTWERRAAMWEWARPRPGEHMGERSPAQAQAKWHELTAIADACRARAALSRQHEGIDPDIDEALGVVA
jgi:hypothetical protein